MDLGGGSQNAGMGIVVDSAQNIYVTGFTDSVDFPTKNPIQASCKGCTSFYSTFLTKINSAGSALVYSTYLGGGANTEASGLAIDASDNVYITGWTDSTDFPLVNAFQTQCGGCSQFKDAFVTKVNAAGTAWVYSTFLGGGVDDLGFGIATDSTGNAYVTGYTYSTNFPVRNPYQSTCSTCSGWEDAFITKVGPSGSLVYSTYLGGSYQDVGTAIAVDSSGNMYVVGYTDSQNFPTKNAFQSTCNSNCAGATYNVFVTKLNSAGSALVYSTYLGGSGTDYGSSIAVDSSGEAYVAGYTKGSSNFPTKNPIQAKSGGARDGFITKFTSAGSALVYSTYFGGSGDDVIGGIVNEVNVGGLKIPIGYLSPGNGLAVDSSGNAYVTGLTGSANFATKNPYQGSLASAGYDVPDAFVTKIAP
jgi:beta-propeller repeat-containing protein